MELHADITEVHEEALRQILFIWLAIYSMFLYTPYKIIPVPLFYNSEKNYVNFKSLYN